jgi:membrane protein required for beta-lactamase induction
LRLLKINLFRYLNFPVKVVVLLSLSLVANFDKGLSLIHKNISQSEISLLDKFDPSLLEEIIYSEESTAEIQRRIRLQQVCKRGIFLWLVIISLMTLFGWTI